MLFEFQVKDAAVTRTMRRVLRPLRDRSLADLRSLRGEGKNGKKGTCCLQWATTARALERALYNIFSFCPLEGHLRGHTIMFYLPWYTQDCTYCKWHFFEH